MKLFNANNIDIVKFCKKKLYFPFWEMFRQTQSDNLVVKRATYV